MILGLFASFTSCKQAPFVVGKIVTETRELPNFREVRLNDNINMSLVRSDTCYIEITTGDNIIGSITTNVENGILTIRNTTTNDWTRPYDYELHATLYYKDIRNFIFASSGTLDTKNQYNDSNYNGVYRFEIDGGSGDVDLLVNDCETFYFVYQFGTSRATLHGTNNGFLDIYKQSYGIFDAKDFKTVSTHVRSYYTADCYVNVSDSLSAEIYHVGNVYYKGNPANITETYGPIARGRLIKL